jgi:predicted Zn-dependent peptidase
MNYQIKTINWLTCIFYDMPHATSVTTQLFVKAGSIYEDETTSGLSHFLEHMFFKGWVRYPTSQDVSRVIDEIGGEHNAYTSDDTASYYIKTAPDFVELAIDVLSDMIINSQFPADELATEQWVVVQEIKMIEDNPARWIYSLRRKWYMGDNPYGRPVIGTEENVLSFTQQMLLDHRNHLYTTQSMVLVVCGKLPNTDLIEWLISKYFVGMQTGDGGSKPDRSVITRPSQKLWYYTKGTEQNHMVITTEWYKYGTSEFYPAKMLWVIMGGNTSSRFWQLLRERHGLCYYASVGHYGDSDDGVFMIRAWLRKDNFDETIELIRWELASIATWSSITQVELDQARGYLIGTLQMWLETSSDVSEWVGSDYLIYGKIETIEEIIQAYRDVTLEQIQQIAHKLLWEEWYTYYIE